MLQDQLHLSATQLGTLFSAFFVTYVLGMVPGGWLADRYGAKLVLGAGAAICSTATLLTGFASGFISLLLLRLLLGLGETAAFPSTSKLIATSIPNAHIGLANGAIGFAYLVGPAVGTFAGGLLMARLGWRPVFAIFGMLSLLWLLPWSRVVVAEPSSRADATADESPMFREILHQRSLWGVALGCFAGSSAVTSHARVVADLPRQARGLSIEWMTGSRRLPTRSPLVRSLPVGRSTGGCGPRSMTLTRRETPNGPVYSVLPSAPSVSRFCRSTAVSRACFSAWVSEASPRWVILRSRSFSQAPAPPHDSLASPTCVETSLGSSRRHSPGC